MSKIDGTYYFNFNDLRHSTVKFCEILKRVTCDLRKKFYISATKNYDGRYAQHCSLFGEDAIDRMFVITSSNKSNIAILETTILNGCIGLETCINKDTDIGAELTEGTNYAYILVFR